MNTLELDLTVPDEIRNDIIEYAKDESKRYELGRNWYQVKIPEIIISDIIPDIEYRPAVALLLNSKPGLIVPAHTDTAMAEHGWRTALTWALYPDPAFFAPSHFFDPRYVHHYTDKCFVFDTWRLHMAIGNDHERGLFQIRYAEGPEELIAAINKSNGGNDDF